MNTGSCSEHQESEHILNSYTKKQFPKHHFRLFNIAYFDYFLILRILRCTSTETDCRKTSTLMICDDVQAASTRHLFNSINRFANNTQKSDVASRQHASFIEKCKKIRKQRLKKTGFIWQIAKKKLSLQIIIRSASD